MVAGEMISQSSVANAAGRLPRGFGKVKFTVDDALALVEAGFLPEDASIELLDGELEYVDRRTKRGGELAEGPDHNLTVGLTADLSKRIDSPSRHLRTQSLVICTPSHSPIPDGVVLRGTIRDYTERLPKAGDVFCVIEVSDSSYDKDAGPKLAAYARAGIPQYVIINLANRTAEVYTRPANDGTYRTKQIIPADGVLALRVGDADETFDVPLAELLS